MVVQRTLHSFVDTVAFDVSVAGLVGIDVAVPRRPFLTRTEVESTSVPGAGTTTLAIMATGHASPGDAGQVMLLRYRASEPAHDGAWQSADGAWWEIENGVVTPEMFGQTGLANDAPVVQKMYDFLALKTGRSALIVNQHILTTRVYVRGDGIVTRASANRWSGFLGGGREGFVQIGDDTDLGNIYRPGGVRFEGILFDGRFQADVGVWLGYRCNRPILVDCRLQGARLATVVVDQDVTAYAIIDCDFSVSGASSAGTTTTIAHALLQWGNGQMQNTTLGSCSGLGIYVLGAPTNPWGDIPIIEENHIYAEGGRITSTGSGLVLIESERLADLVVSGSATFERGEPVTGAGGATGRFWRKIGSTIRLIEVEGEWTTGSITGATSGAYDTVTTASTAYGNQGETGMTRADLRFGYLENPFNFAGQDGVDVNIAGGDAVIGRGRRTALKVSGGTKWHFRKANSGFLASHDARVEIWGPNTISAQWDGAGSPNFELARSDSAGDGTAQANIMAWPQEMQSTGAVVSAPDDLTPDTSWAGFIAGGPNFGGLGVRGPDMVGVETPLDGTTIALTNWADPSGTATVDATHSQTSGSSIKYTGDGVTASGGKGIAFDWTPPATLLNKKCLIVAVMKLEQVGSTFGGTGSPPAPRVQIASASGSGKCWPDPGFSLSNQNIAAPGAGNLTPWFTVCCGFIPRTTDPLRITVSMSTRTAATNDIMWLDRVMIYRMDPDPFLDLAA